MFLRVPIGVLVSSPLFLEEEASLTVSVQSWTFPVTCPEGLCHVVNGGTDCAFSQGSVTARRVAGFTHGLGECGDEEGSGPGLIKGFKEGIVVDADFIEKEAPSSPAAILLILCLTCRCFLTGIFTSKEQAQDSITDCSGAIKKLVGSCEGI